jgi:hypothetical protein
VEAAAVSWRGGVVAGEAVGGSSRGGVAAVAAVSLVSGAGAAASGAAHRCPTPESDLCMTHTSSTWPDTVDRAWAAYVLYLIISSTPSYVFFYAASLCVKYSSSEEPPPK